MMPDEPAAYAPNEKEIYEWLALQISREDGLVNNRMSWTLAFQGLIFAGLAFAAEKGESNKELWIAFSWVLPWLGVSSALLCALSVEAALAQLRWLRHVLDCRFRARELVFVRPTGHATPHILGNLYPRVIPWLMISAWILVMIAI